MSQKFCLCAIFIMISILGIIIIFPHQNQDLQNSDFLRIHIRANSNDTADQNVKYIVKNEIVQVMNSFLAYSKTKQEAISNIENNLSKIIETANQVLNENGFNYSASASIKQENFPTRKYDDLVLESGIYDALIINLGSGKGDNWWCVVYPPLCFLPSTQNGNTIIYRSKLLEIIENFFK